MTATVTSATSTSQPPTPPTPTAPARGVAPPSAVEQRAWRTVARLLDGVHTGTVSVRLPDATERRFGAPGTGPDVHLDVHDWAFFRRVLVGGSVGLGESYMAGEWDCDDLTGFVWTVIANRDVVRRLTPASLLQVAADLALHVSRANRIGQASRNIAAHYDLSNDLYRLFLDETMTYSSAWFPHADATLEEAQHAKYARLADKVRLRPGDHVLEVGCGWGGFALYAAGERGCRVTGITLSRAQADEARRRVAAAGLTDRVEIQLVDYRALTPPPGGFDRIVSIEMLEAVGHRYLPDYFAALDRLLAADGLVGVQVIAIPEQRYGAYRLRPDFINKHIFPGGHLPSLAAMTRAMGRASDLYVHEVENIGPHYATTLHRWRDRFLANLDGVRALGFDDRFVRMWEFYLAYCEGAFRAHYVADYQLVLTRPLNRTLAAPSGG